MNGITLQKNGDCFEQNYHGLFLVNEFPSYEIFWLKFVVPMTNRPINIHFTSDPELAALGRGHNEVCIAQLHYSVFRHLVRAFQIKSFNQIDLNRLTEAIVRLVGAQDIAFELLERYINPSNYDPWLPSDSKKARRAWQNKENNPLQDIRNYRNHLVHGRVLPDIIIGQDLYVPRIGIENNYFDWRKITNNPNNDPLVGVDFIRPNDVLEDAWTQTIAYIENKLAT